MPTSAASEKRPRSLTSWIRRLLLLLAAVLAFIVIGDVFFTVEENGRGYQAAFGTPEGGLEKQLIASAGAPDRVTETVTEGCSKLGGVRELVYESATTGLFGWGRRVVNAQVVICVANDGRIKQALHVEI